MSASAKKTYRPETRLVQSGTLRSQFGETSEAMFLTQGYVYDTAAQAEARFKGEDPGYQYSRFANPTVDMFERRMAAFEGAEAARATATGMAAVTLALVGQVKAGDHVVAAKAMFGSCRYIVEDYLPRFGVSTNRQTSPLPSRIRSGPGGMSVSCCRIASSGRVASQMRQIEVSEWPRRNIIVPCTPRRSLARSSVFSFSTGRNRA